MIYVEMGIDVKRSKVRFRAAKLCFPPFKKTASYVLNTTANLLVRDGMAKLQLERLSLSSRSLGLTASQRADATEVRFRAQWRAD